MNEPRFFLCIRQLWKLRQEFLGVKNMTHTADYEAPDVSVNISIYHFIGKKKVMTFHEIWFLSGKLPRPYEKFTPWPYWLYITLNDFANYIHCFFYTFSSFNDCWKDWVRII